MSYVEQSLIAGEQVLYKTGLHWSVLVGPVILACFFGLPGLFMLIGSIATLSDKSTSGMGPAGFVLLLLAGVCVLLGYLKRKGTEMAVTNKRILIKTGLVSRKTFELLLSKGPGELKQLRQRIIAARGRLQDQLENAYMDVAQAQADERATA